MKLTSIAVFSIIPILGLVSSCREKGPAEKAGESLDKAIEDVQNSVNPKGPIEKAGEKVDRVLGN